jgi:hypothetical protein
MGSCVRILGIQQELQSMGLVHAEFSVAMLGKLHCRFFATCQKGYAPSIRNDHVISDFC